MKRTLWKSGMFVFAALAMVTLALPLFSATPPTTVVPKQQVTTPQAANIPALPPSFDCTVQGTPVEFPDDIVIKNTGAAKVAKGTKVHWEIPNSGRKGDYTFTADLLPGASVMVSGVVGGGFGAGAKCNVTVIKPLTVMKTPTAQRVPLPTFQQTIQCYAAGSPEFTSMLIVKNTASAMIPKGKVIHWSFDSVRQGDYTLVADLPVGQQTSITMPGSVTAGAKCTATVK